MTKRNSIRIKNRNERLAWADALPVGEFYGWVDLRWYAPESFLFLPAKENPFCFVRANGERIMPDAFSTDGATMKIWHTAATNITRWQYGPAMVTHDWTWHLHSLGRPIMTFEETNILLAEAMRTVMARGMCETRLQDIIIIYDAVSSPVARRRWNKLAKEILCPPF